MASGRLSEAILRGLGAGMLGTVAMTGWQELAQGLKSSGGDDGKPPSDPWEEAPVPAKVARRIGERVLGRAISPERIPLLTNVMHWGYGIGWGGVYGILAARKTPRLRTGLAFGTTVWAMSYVELVPVGLYQPPWRYPPQELAFDLSYHLVYGAGTGLGYRVLDHRKSH